MISDAGWGQRTATALAASAAAVRTLLGKVLKRELRAELAGS